MMWHAAKRSLSDDAHVDERMHPGVVDVAVINRGGVGATLSAGFTFESVFLTAVPLVIRPCGQLNVSWLAPAGRSCNGGGDWVALYRVGELKELWFTHLCGSAAGTSSLFAPLQPGEYEFRYMVEDTAVARSSQVTVTGAASPSIPALLARER
jgi:hypothetical protein